MTCSHEPSRFIVVGCLVEKLGDRERTSEATRYYVLDTITGKQTLNNDGTTFRDCWIAHLYAKSRESYG